MYSRAGRWDPQWSGLLLVAVAACGDCRSENRNNADAALPDAEPDAAIDAVDAFSGPCSPILQLGCATGEKCTWIVDIDGTSTMTQVGHVGCAPDGAIEDGKACTDAMAAVNGGADACMAGDLCVSRTCKPICDPAIVAETGPGACRANFGCITHDGVFTSQVGVSAGVCEPGCDPLTQRLKTDLTEACGSLNPAAPSATCVPGATFRSFQCAPSGAPLYGNTDRRPPLTNGGVPFPNGCAPGFIPFYLESSSSMRVLCTGMCAPAKVDAEIAVGNPDLHAGDPTAAGKLVADGAPVAGHSTCHIDVKGSIAADPQGNGVEDCRYLWFPLADGDPSRAVNTPYNDTLGVCFDYNAFVTVDTDGDGVPDAPQKSCAELPVTAPPDDPFGSARDNGCYPLSESMGLRRDLPRIGRFRLANGDGVMVRHVFD